MKYPTDLRAAVKLWHPTATVKEVEKALGRGATIFHEVGQLRTKGDKAAYHETYCYFDLSGKKKIDLGDLIAACLAVLRRRRAHIDALLASGGRVILSVKVVNREFIQLYLEKAQVAELASLNVGIVFE